MLVITISEKIYAIRIKFLPFRDTLAIDFMECKNGLG